MTLGTEYTMVMMTQAVYVYFCVIAHAEVDIGVYGYLSNIATRFQKFHFWSNMVNLFNLEVPFLSEI